MSRGGGLRNKDSGSACRRLLLLKWWWLLLLKLGSDLRAGVGGLGIVKRGCLAASLAPGGGSGEQGVPALPQ